MILSHTLYPPGWNFPSDTQTQSSQALKVHIFNSHKEALSHKHSRLWHPLVSKLFLFPPECHHYSLGMAHAKSHECGQKPCSSETRARLFTYWIYIELPRVHGTLVTRIPFPFKGERKNSLISPKYQQRAKFSWSTGPGGQTTAWVMWRSGGVTGTEGVAD